MSKISNRTISFARAIFIAALIAIVIAKLSSCTTPQIIGKGYITFIEREKESEFKKFTSSTSIDSLVNTQFKSVVNRFNADSVFKGNNLFIIGVDTCFIYIEQKNRIQKFRIKDDEIKPVGKVKLKTIKK